MKTAAGGQDETRRVTAQAAYISGGQATRDTYIDTDCMTRVYMKNTSCIRYT